MDDEIKIFCHTFVKCPDGLYRCDCLYESPKSDLLKVLDNKVMACLETPDKQTVVPKILTDCNNSELLDEAANKELGSDYLLLAGVVSGDNSLVR